MSHWSHSGDRCSLHGINSFLAFSLAPCTSDAILASDVTYGRHEAPRGKDQETVDSSAKEHGHLNATNVTMVSESCKSSSLEHSEMGRAA